MSERERAAGPPALAARPAPVSPAAESGSAPARRTRILLVEDEPALLRALRIGLRARGYEVLTAETGSAALSQARRRTPDVLLLDLGLPDRDGTEVIEDLRRWSSVPVIVMSGRAGVHDKVGAFDAGADDYVTKPFDMDELLARLRAALRRGEPAPPPRLITIGRCQVDLTACAVVRQSGAADPSADPPAGSGTGSGTGPGTGPGAGAGEPVHLTPTEWRLLEILLRSPGQLIAAGTLLDEVWGAGSERNSRYLRFHLAGLRRKLEDDPPRPRHLLTEPGMGYRYQP